MKLVGFQQRNNLILVVFYPIQGRHTGFMYFEEMNDDDIHDILDKIVLSAQ